MAVTTWCHMTGFQLAQTNQKSLKKELICFSTRAASTVDFISGWHYTQNILYKLFSVSSTRSDSFCPLVWTSLLWPQSWVCHNWSAGLWLVCHDVVWMKLISIPSVHFPLLFILIFSMVWPECGRRFTQRLGNTHNKLPLLGNTLQYCRTSAVNPPWEPRPPCNQASKNRNTDSLPLPLVWS